MKKLFDDLSFEISKRTTEKYSTSFSLGILALKPSIRPAVYAIYGYVRLADEIVDSFHGYDKQRLLSRLKSDTWEALEEKISVNPIMHSFQETVNAYAIDRELIAQFLSSMEMDLGKVDYNSALYQQYIFGSAEVVGLMCLQVFVNGDKQRYEELKPYAMKLGSAFQKVNFLRDLKDDYQTLGRTYFPNIEMGVFNNQVKTQIENEIAQEFSEALEGIKKLPNSSKFGVYLAYKYYLCLFEKIRRSSSSTILERRVRVHNSQKAYVALKSYVRYKTAIL